MHNAGRLQRLISSTDPVIFKMPRSPQKVINWRALTFLLALSLFASFMLVEAGAQGRRSRPAQTTSPSLSAPQAQRKNIASVRSLDTSDGSRVTITSDVPLNDYEAYWGGDRFFVIIPNAEITYQNVQTLQASLRGRGFQDVRIERKGNDLVFSFRMQAGFRARPEQKFNRLDIILTAPPGMTFPQTGNNGQTGTQGGGSGRPTGGGGTTATTGGQLGGGTSGTSTGGGGGTSSSGGGSTASAGSGRRTTSGGGGRGRGRSGGYSGYSGGGGDRGGGGTALNIPLPSDIQQQTQTPTPTPLATGTPSTATTTASPTASPGTTESTAQANASPATSLSPTPEQIARNEPPVTAPPATSTSNTNQPAPAATTGFAAAIREYWLPLLIGLLVLGAIVLLMASRSRAESAEGRETERLRTGKQETIKDKPSSRTGAAIAGGAAAGAAAVAAMSKESRAKATAPAAEPVKEPVKDETTKAVEPVPPAVGMEEVGAEVKSLLEGKDYDQSVITSTNPDTRQIVSTELLAALASRNPQRRLRAREAFINHGFFDESTRRLRTSANSAERVSAARALGLTQDQSATPHLVAALEDDDPEVRRAAVNALAELRDPSAIGPLNALLEREKNRKVPHSLIRRAIEASATIDLPEATAPTPAAATAKDPTATSAEKKDKDDDDREVFEI